MKREHWTPREYTPKETKMIISGRYVKNALVWINRAMRRKQISDEEREAMKDIQRLLVETDMAFVAYANLYIRPWRYCMKKVYQEVDDAFGNTKVSAYSFELDEKQGERRKNEHSDT